MSKDPIAQKIHKNTRRKFSAEEKIRLVLEGLRANVPVSELCRREVISPTVFYRWSKDFLEAGKNGLTRDTKRDANDEEVRRLRQDNEDLKRGLAEQVLEVQRLKKSLGIL